ncbi:MAG: GCN5-related N-acetyltransferase [Polaromonas sp.]|nr:GCN5-related N-acetyltransferase [Polaromonas sp.]
MGRLACRAESQGRGLGQLLMGFAVGRCLQARQQVGAFALLVDAKNEKAKAFCQHYGFTACMDSPITLYLPLG